MFYILDLKGSEANHAYGESKSYCSLTKLQTLSTLSFTIHLEEANDPEKSGERLSA